MLPFFICIRSSDVTEFDGDLKGQRTKDVCHHYTIYFRCRIVARTGPAPSYKSFAPLWTIVKDRSNVERVFALVPV